MPLEIERKFLVAGTPWQGLPGIWCRQGYLNLGPGNTVRVRVAAGQGYLTVKGASRGAVRSEFEYPIPVTDAEEILHELCLQPIIDKTRYLIKHAGLTWEIDVFAGENQGLVIAEVELDDEQQTITLPPWAGKEVTGDQRYFNAYLVNHPYVNWPDAST
ncbi:MAG: adenylate cyclase [Desulfuromonas sp.]|nr:MAG: adenylate cyclase [Desulfuromonas sp.]